jgi:hypothetical protein
MAVAGYVYCAMPGMEPGKRSSNIEFSKKNMGLCRFPLWQPRRMPTPSPPGAARRAGREWRHGLAPKGAPVGGLFTSRGRRGRLPSPLALGSLWVNCSGILICTESWRSGDLETPTRRSAPDQRNASRGPFFICYGGWSQNLPVVQSRYCSGD